MSQGSGHSIVPSTLLRNLRARAEKQEAEAAARGDEVEAKRLRNIAIAARIFLADHPETRIASLERKLLEPCRVILARQGFTFGPPRPLPIFASDRVPTVQDRRAAEEMAERHVTGAASWDDLHAIGVAKLGWTSFADADGVATDVSAHADAAVRVAGELISTLYDARASLMRNAIDGARRLTERAAFLHPVLHAALMAPLAQSGHRLREAGKAGARKSKAARQAKAAEHAADLLVHLEAVRKRHPDATKKAQYRFAAEDYEKASGKSLGARTVERAIKSMRDSGGAT